MADRIRSVDFLPEIFQTSTNKKFLGSTFDQLIQEPKIKRTQGFVGKRTGPSVSSTDTYIVENDVTRANYQLEPGIIFNDSNNNTQDVLTYPGLIDGLETKGADVQNHDRLFSSETYSWSPFVDFDKFVNYSQYYWLPQGPDSVDVGATDIFLSDEFNFNQNTLSNTYNIADIAGENPTITLVRSGNYTFTSTGNLYIQTEPGTSGSTSYASNITSRDIDGVINNGTPAGILEFHVPDVTSQEFYRTLTYIGTVDLASDLKYNDINNVLVSSLTNGINNIGDLQGKTIIFLDNTTGLGTNTGWVNQTRFNNDSYDSNTFETFSEINNLNDRYQIFKINLVYDINGENPYVDLLPFKTVNTLEKVTITHGDTYSNVDFFKNSQGFFERVPVLTATLDTLYYQDSSNPGMFGKINIVDQDESAVLFIDEILGKKVYTSANGVVFTNGLKVQFRGQTSPQEYQDVEYYIEGVGTAIKLLPVSEFITPEPFTDSILDTYEASPFDTIGYNGSLDAPLTSDYITINKASNDRNAWSRSNRWTHIDVITKTAEYNNTVVVTDNNFRANRPILEFEANLKLFNHGTQGKTPVDVIDFTETDALSNINGLATNPGYFVDGYKLANNTRIIFAADTDSTVRDKIFVVSYEDLNADGNETIVLTLADDSATSEGHNILTTSGTTLIGKSYVFANSTWLPSQEKTKVNQPPLFDLFDTDGISLANRDRYTASTFIGTKLFSYAIGAGQNDTVLGFPLKYLNIGNLGDITFKNDLYTDSFDYVSVTASTSDNLSKHFARTYQTITDYTSHTGWVRSAEIAHIPQIFNYIYEGKPLVVDITPTIDLKTPAIKVIADNQFVTTDNYTLSITDSTLITLNNNIAIGTPVEVLIISNTASSNGYYQVPQNLSQNVFNGNTSELTLGTIRNHYITLAQNILDFSGNINGANNLRDLGQVPSYGLNIIQQSAPVALASTFIRKNEYNFYDSIKFSSRAYEKFKNQLVDWVAKHDVFELSSAEILEQALTEINVGKSTTSAFYNSDMIPSGTDFEATQHLVTAISSETFNTVNIFDFTQANNKALLVYLNDTILLKDIDYTVSADSPNVTFLVDLVVDDVILFMEYNSTVASGIPSTPTKMGMYQKYKPVKYLDDTYVTPVNVIRGHDGSITVAFDDIRDDVLLEFEKRIFNNIKVNSDTPLSFNDINPGQFRTTDYTDSEITEILTPSLVSWLGWNKIDYVTQAFDSTNDKTKNYSKSVNKLDGNILKGNWRGIYNHLYDTDSPHTRPWEMLGLSLEPIWWQQQYGPAPYTSGNLVLWDDLALGLIKDPVAPYIAEKYIRPQLLEIIPVDSEGRLLSPLENVVAAHSAFDFQQSWKVGDQSPAESAFRKSSAWPFAVQRLLSLTKPAQYFSLNADRDRYKFSEEHNQYLLDGRSRLNVKELEIASTTNKNSYVNWIIDYNKFYGYNSSAELSNVLANLDVSLCYRMAAFTDKDNLKVFTDRSSPDSLNNSLLLPDESYNLLVHKNQPFDEVVYSAITVQKVQDGYAVYGNSNTDPYFKIRQSLSGGKFKKIVVGNTSRDATTIRIPQTFSNRIAYIPYGYVFTNKHAVVDFIISYGAYLSERGLRFENTENNVEVNWTSMASEFTYWSDQGWGDSAIINLNPAAEALEFEREFTVVDSLLNMAVNEQPQDQNRQLLLPSDYVVDRIENNFKISTINDKIISYLNFNLTSFEHILVLDNTSIFSDLIYDPVTGVRQTRVKLVGFTSTDWNGQVDAQGFLLNDDNVAEWASTSSYNKGEMIRYKNSVYAALEKVSPSELFNLSSWAKIDYTNVATGALPNLATKSNEMLQFYNSKTANLEKDNDLFSLGLIGFRPREYLTSLDLSDISQVNVYQDIVKSKGTASSLDLFRNTTINNAVTDYEIFENWAVKRAEYGATNSRGYVEVQLDETQLNDNPSTVQITNGISAASQQILVGDIFNQSVKHSTNNIYPMRKGNNEDIQLPTAGFVTENEVSFSVFSLNDLSEITSQVNDIVDGSTIWVAKDNDYSWNVYRTKHINPEIIRVSDNLDGTITIDVNSPHTLVTDDKIIIKYVDPQINGAHNITSILSDYKIVIAGSLDAEQIEIENTGNIFLLTSSRVSTPSDIANSDLDNKLFSTDKVWVDTNDNLSHVYAKQDLYAESKTTQPPVINNNYGKIVAQGTGTTGAFVADDTTVYAYTKKATGLVLKEQFAIAAIDIKFNDTTAIVLTSTEIQIIARVESEKAIDYSLVETIPYANGEILALSADNRWFFVSNGIEVTGYNLNNILKYENKGTIPLTNVTAIDVSDNASQIVLGDNTDTVRVYSRVVERFVVEANMPSYTTLRNYSNGAIHINNIVTEDYIAAANVITLANPVVGDFLEVDINDYVEIATIVGTTGSSFGESVSLCNSQCSLYIGSPTDSTQNINEGTVTRYINTARMNGYIISNFTTSLTATDTIRINNIDVFVGTTLSDLVDNINAKNIPNVTSRLFNNQIMIELKNKLLTSLASKLDVLPGIGFAFSDLNFTVYDAAQIIRPPISEINANFGKIVEIDINKNHLLVSSAGTTQKLAPIDNRSTTFDGKSMRLVDAFEKSGAIYTYDILQDVTEFSAGKLAFGQQVYNTTVTSNSLYGNKATLVDGDIIVSTPGSHITLYSASSQARNWESIRSQQPQTDINMINAMYLYSNSSEDILSRLDYIDPLNGKILGAAQQNLDYITPTDPAVYGSATSGILWSKANVGQIWWDVSTVRFVDYFQKDVNVAANLWGSVFKGSSVDVYQWTESKVPPTLFAGDVLDTTNFVSLSEIKDTVIETTYYYWVKNGNTILTNSEKTLSPSAIASYIKSPSSSGIAYAAIINKNTVGLYNTKSKYIDNETVLHVEFDNVKNDANIFQEYELIRENHKTDFLPAGLYKKLLDSFVGADTQGNKVPDIKLNASERYGVNFRPRQTMFKDRLAALKNYILKVNAILITTPAAENKVYPLLKTEEPLPSPTTYDIKVQDLTELEFQNLALVPAGFKYLVVSNESVGGFWTIHEVTPAKILKLTRVQSFDTTRFWKTVDWYKTASSKSEKIQLTVQTINELDSVDFNVVTFVKVLDNSASKWELYQYSNNSWTRVAVQDGTLEFSAALYDYSLLRYGYDFEVYEVQKFDEEPLSELRNILKSINEEILTNDLKIERNILLISVFNYILSEQENVHWLNKTSLIDVNHKVRELLPYAVFNKDNQDYVIDYINEVKPYHTKIKDFKLSYTATDLNDNVITDFDCPSIYSAPYSKFISPVLDDGALLLTEDSNTLASDSIWSAYPHNQWFNNRQIIIDSIELINPGINYTEIPTITITGDANILPVAKARIDSDGLVTSIYIETQGSGFTTTPTVLIEGGNGLDATARIVTKNDLVRSFTTTIKYDRYEYNTNVYTWPLNEADYIKIEENASADRLARINSSSQISTGYDTAPFDTIAFDNISDEILVKYNSSVYTVNSGLLNINDEKFIPSQHTLVDIEELSGMDRTQGFYEPGANDKGLNIPMLINGLEYPGVQINGVDFNTIDGYDLTPYDFGKYDNVTLDNLGFPTFNENILDAEYASKFPGQNILDNTVYTNNEYSIVGYSDSLDEYNGTRPSDVDVVGGGFVDTYSSHAPEELVPGQMFDTLLLTVRTRFGTIDQGNFIEAPDARTVDFRYFQDMRGNYAHYTLHPTVEATLSSPLYASDEVIHVDDTSNLFTPVPSQGLFGIITINGERITYLNKTPTTLYGLRRGTAGTGTMITTPEQFTVNDTSITADNVLLTADAEAVPGASDTGHLAGSLIYNANRETQVPVKTTVLTALEFTVNDFIQEPAPRGKVRYSLVLPGFNGRTGKLSIKLNDAKFNRFQTKAVGTKPLDVKDPAASGFNRANLLPDIELSFIGDPGVFTPTDIMYIDIISYANSWYEINNLGFDPFNDNIVIINNIVINLAPPEEVGFGAEPYDFNVKIPRLEDQFSEQALFIKNEGI